MSNNKKSLSILMAMLSVFPGLAYSALPTGDLAPLGAPDGVLNAADIAIVEKIAKGEYTPTPEEFQIADVAPLYKPDGVINVADVALLQRMAIKKTDDKVSYPFGTTPSLVGYWPSNDGKGTIVKDYSQYAHDLTLRLSPYTEDMLDFWKYDGYVYPNNFHKFSIDGIGTPLETGDNVVLGCLEMYWDTSIPGITDIDTGGFYLLKNATSTSPGTGIGWSSVHATWWRVRAENGTAPGTFSVHDTGYSPYISSSPYLAVVCGIFTPYTHPNARIMAWQTIYDVTENGLIYVRTEELTSPGTVPDTTISLQKGLFSLSQVGIKVAYKNLQFWSFASEPVNLEETAQWLTRNPGRIPPWWAGQ